MIQRGTWKSTAALLSLILWSFSLELSVAVYLGHQIFGPGWMDPVRERIVYLVTMILSLFHWFVGRKLMKLHIQRGDASRRSMQSHQVITVVVLLIAGGAFGTWLFCAR